MQDCTCRSCPERIFPSGKCYPRAKSTGSTEGGIKTNVTYTTVGSIRVPDPVLYPAPARKSSSSARSYAENSRRKTALSPKRTPRALSQCFFSIRSSILKLKSTVFYRVPPAGSRFSAFLLQAFMVYCETDGRKNAPRRTADNETAVFSFKIHRK